MLLIIFTSVTNLSTTIDNGIRCGAWAQSTTNRQAENQTTPNSQRHAWHGVVPGETKIKEAIKILGTPSAKSEKGTQSFYKFDGGAVQIQVDTATGTVSYITVNSSVKNDPAFPRNKFDALRMYSAQLGLSGLSQDKLKKVGSHIDGLTVECTFGESPDPQLKELKFKPLTIVDSRLSVPTRH